jgi:hypothetical protein
MIDQLKQVKQEEIIVHPQRDWIATANAEAERLQPLADLLTNAAKFGIMLSTAPILLGAILLISFVHAAGAPLPAFDTSTGVFLIVIAATLMTGVMTIGTFLVWPFISKARNPQLVRTVFPGLNQAPSESRLNFEFLRAYLIFFLPFLFTIFVLGFEIFVTNSRPVHYPLLLVLLPFLFGAAVELVIRARIGRSSACSIKMRDSVAVVCASFEPSFFALVWTLVLTLIPLEVLSRLWRNANLIQASLASLAIIVLLIMVHMCIYAKDVKQTSALALPALILLFCVVIQPGSSFLGGLTLRYLGVGGALPVSLIIKGSGDTTRQVKGCLVVLLSGQASIVQTENPEKNCHLTRSGALDSSPVQNRRVDTYQRSDLLTLSLLSVPQNDVQK